MTGRQSKYGKPIAQRLLLGNSTEKQHELLVRLFAPFKAAEDLWRCPYDIIEREKVYIESDAAGADSVQALILALYKIETQLRHSEKLSSIALKEDTDGGFGFLAPREAWTVHDR